MSTGIACLTGNTNIGTSALATTGTGGSYSSPYAPEVGDLLLLSVTCGDATITTPTGWTQIENVAVAATIRSALYQRVAAGTALDAPDVTLSGSNKWITLVFIIHGPNVSPVDDSATADDPASSTAAAIPTVAPNFATEFILSILGTAGGSGTTIHAEAIADGWAQTGGEDNAPIRVIGLQKISGDAGSYGGLNGAAIAGGAPSVGITVSIHVDALYDTTPAIGIMGCGP